MTVAKSPATSMAGCIAQLPDGSTAMLQANEDGSLRVSGLSSRGNASSGTAAKVTSGNDPVTLLAADPNKVFSHLRVINTCAVAGFVSYDGSVWHYLPASTALTMHGVEIVNHTVQMKRIVDGSNLTGVYASAW